MPDRRRQRQQRVRHDAGGGEANPVRASNRDQEPEKEKETPKETKAQTGRNTSTGISYAEPKQYESVSIMPDKEVVEPQKYSRSGVLSNWSRYEEINTDEPEEGEDYMIGEDFNNILQQQQGNSSSYLRLKGESDWGSDEMSILSSHGLGALHVADLITAINTLPLYTQLNIPQDCLPVSVVDYYTELAENNRQVYKPNTQFKDCSELQEKLLQSLKISENDGFSKKGGNFESNEGGGSKNGGNFETADSKFETNEGIDSKKGGKFESKESEGSKNGGNFEKREGDSSKKSGSFEKREGDSSKKSSGKFESKESGGSKKSGNFELANSNSKTDIAFDLLKTIDDFELDMDTEKIDGSEAGVKMSEAESVAASEAVSKRAVDVALSLSEAFAPESTDVDLETLLKPCEEEGERSEREKGGREEEENEKGRREVEREKEEEREKVREKEEGRGEKGREKEREEENKKGRRGEKGRAKEGEREKGERSERDNNSKPTAKVTPSTAKAADGTAPFDFGLPKAKAQNRKGAEGAEGAGESKGRKALSELSDLFEAEKRKKEKEEGKTEEEKGPTVDLDAPIKCDEPVIVSKSEAEDLEDWLDSVLDD